MANPIKPCKEPQPSNTSLIGKFVKNHNVINFPKTSRKSRQNPMVELKPKQNECLDYNLSQTSFKLDAGETKIHYCETTGTYVPIPPELNKQKTKKIKRIPHGTPPQWIFIDEIWLKEQEKMQKVYKKRLRKIIQRRKAIEKTEGVGLHAKIIDMVGPKWFQELSPNQIKRIEQLENSIKKDLKQQTTSNTVEIIDYLGLNPRPNERKFRSALKQSAGSPVEFLLALYYQIRKNETTYTINDRLLLSSVVHLTMTNTLREMHIRSPSPPPSPKPQPPVERTPKSKTYYESPYLIPFNFQPEPKKFTGIYKNKHLQYPESDYFNYIPQLKSDMFLGNVYEDNPESWKLEEREIIEEMLIAQQLYNRFCENTVKLKLLKASTWKDYSLFESPQMQYDDFCEIEEEFEENDSTKPKLNNIFEDESSLDLVPSISISSNTKNNLEKLKFEQLPCNSNCKMQLESLLTGKCPNWEQTKRKQFNCTINSGVVIRQDEKIPIIQGIKDNSCSCIENYKRTIADYEYKNEIKRQQNVLKTSALATYCINGVCVTKNGPIYVTNAIKPKFQLNQLENSLNQVKTMQNNMLEYEINKKKYYEEENELKTRLELIKARREGLEKILPGKCLANNKKECDCVETYLNHLNLVEHNTRLQEAVNYIKTQKVKFTIGGVTYRSNSPVFIINGVSPIVNKRKYNECIKYLEEFKDMLLKKEPDFKYEGEKTCPECIGIVEQYLNQMTKTTVIKLPERPKTPEEIFEPICKCKEETEKKLEDLCKCSAFQPNKHPTLIKSGIKLTQSGTEINILDRVYDKACTCLPEYKDKMEKFELYKKRIEARLKLMNEKEKFVISGVCQTPKGPVYNISNVLTPGYCCCSEFADEEEARERHRQAMPKAPIQDGVKFSICGVRETPEGNVYILDNAIQQDACICMRLFEQFQNEHSFCTKTYKRFEENLKQSLQKYYSEAENEKMQTKEEDNVKEPKEIVLSTSSSRISSCNCHVPLSKHENSKDSCTCDENFTEVTDVLNNSPKNNEDSVVSVKNMEDLSSEKEPVKSLKSEKVTESLISIKSKSELTDEQNEATKSFTLDSINLKRYLILRKFPCKKKKQMAILKKLLNSLAEDGYPLAKLPDSYKLPHFKLWLDLRCGKFWTQADRKLFDAQSIVLWQHADTCKPFLARPELPISRQKAATLTWAKSTYCKRIIQNSREEYYRSVKHSILETTREFFPTLFTYEFPNKTFRDVFFSYEPSKELQVLPYRLVQKHEMAPPKKRLRCKLC